MDNFFEHIGESLNKTLKEDISYKQVEQLKQLMKKLNRLNYSNVDRSCRHEFQQMFIQRLRDIQIEIEEREKAGQYISMQNVFTEITTMLTNHISNVEMLSELNADFKGAPTCTKRTKKQYNLSETNSF